MFFRFSYTTADIKLLSGSKFVYLNIFCFLSVDILSTHLTKKKKFLFDVIVASKVVSRGNSEVPVAGIQFFFF